METLAEALPKEIKRVKEELIPEYEAIGNAGLFALQFMRQYVTSAEKAILDGDTVAMIQWYQKLKECE